MPEKLARPNSPIHDGLAQELAAALMQSQVHEHLKGAKPDKARKVYDRKVMLLQ